MNNHQRRRAIVNLTSMIDKLRREGEHKDVLDLLIEARDRLDDEYYKSMV